MLSSLLTTISRYAMLSSGDRVIVAVSGGPDSVALLDALWKLRDDLAISLHVAHLHHGLRGPDADEDAAFVRSLAKSRGLPVTVGHIDVPALKKVLKGSVQEVARMARYRFLEETASTVGAARVGLGHTADDLIETVLLNLLRGTGPEGLRGIPPVRLPFIRPLLETTRAEILDYCRRENLAFREDPSNRKPHYLRNRIRLELLPLLEKEYHPGIRQSLLRLSALISDEMEISEAAVAEAWAEAVKAASSERVSLKRDVWERYPPSLQRRLLRRAIREVRGDLSGIPFGTIERILASLRISKPLARILPGGSARISGGAEALIIERYRKPADAKEFEHPLSIPGVTLLPEIGRKVSASFLPQSPASYPSAESREAVLDADSFSGALIARNWRPGDRIRPLGMQGTKKLQDILVDRKVSSDLRSRIIVVADAAEILWVAGVAISEKAKGRAGTTRWLLLSVEDLPGQAERLPEYQ